MNLKGKTILVTGSARRIGRVLALAVAKAGGDVIVHHNNSPDEAEITKQDISALGQEATILQADFSDPESTEEFIREAFSSRKLDGLVNNASVFSNLSWADTKLSQWNNHLSINLTAPFLLSQAFGKNISKNLDGRIINILDWRALQPGADHLPYTISKAGLAALTKSLAIALAPNITVNGIAFGAVLPPSEYPLFSSHTALGRNNRSRGNLFIFISRTKVYYRRNYPSGRGQTSKLSLDPLSIL